MTKKSALATISCGIAAFSLFFGGAVYAQSEFPARTQALSADATDTSNEQASRQIYVSNGALDSRDGDGSEGSPYASIFYALSQAKDGDTILLTENITINGVKNLSIDKAVTIDGSQKNITLRDLDIELANDVTFKNIGLKFLTDGTPDLSNLKVGKIIVNDHSLVLDNVNTVISAHQQDDTPIVVAGAANTSVKQGAGAQIIMRNSTENTRFKSIILGNLQGAKNTPSTVTTDNRTVVTDGIIASSFNNQPVTQAVRIELNGNSIARVLNDGHSPQVSVTVGAGANIAGAEFANLQELRLENGARLSFAEDPYERRKHFQKITVSETAVLNFGGYTEITAEDIDLAGTIALNVEKNQLVVGNKITGNGEFDFVGSAAGVDPEKDVIVFVKGEPSEIKVKENPQYQLKKTEQGYAVTKNKMEQESDKYEPKLPGKKLQVANPQSLTLEEDAALVAAIKLANKDYLPSDTQYYVEDGSLFVQYQDGSYKQFPLSELVEKKQETQQPSEVPQSSETQQPSEAETKPHTQQEQPADTSPAKPTDSGNTVGVTPGGAASAGTNPQKPAGSGDTADSNAGNDNSAGAPLAQPGMQAQPAPQSNNVKSEKQNSGMQPAELPTEPTPADSSTENNSGAAGSASAQTPQPGVVPQPQPAPAPAVPGKKSPGVKAGQQREVVIEQDNAKPFEVTFAGNYADLLDYSVDGQPVTAEQVQVRSGSTIFTFSPEYLQSLSAGEHTLTAVYKESKEFAGGAYKFKFTVHKAEAKITADVKKTENGKQMQPKNEQSIKKQLANTGVEGGAAQLGVVILLLSAAGFTGAFFRKQKNR